MKQAAELYNTLKQMFSASDSIFPAIVKSVDKTRAVVDVEFNELEIGDVRLMALIDDDVKGVKYFPKVESIVLIEKLGNKGEYFIVMMSEAEEVNITIGTTVFKQNLNGFEISKGTENLKAVIADLIEQIKLITVNCTAPGTPSGVPINATAFTAIGLRIENLLQ